jgi:hypothetical protein
MLFYNNINSGVNLQWRKKLSNIYTLLYNNLYQLINHNL